MKHNKKLQRKRFVNQSGLILSFPQAGFGCNENCICFESFICLHLLHLCFDIDVFSTEGHIRNHVSRLFWDPVKLDENKS